MPRLAIVSPSFWPMVGGVEAYVRGLGRELVHMGYDVTVYTPDSVLGIRISERIAEIDGVKVHRVHVPLDLTYRLRLWPGLAKELNKGRPDIIHVYSHDSYALLALFAARSSGTPMVLTTYGPFYQHSDYGLLEKGVLRLYDSVVSPRLLRGCDRVMIRYPGISHWLESMGVPQERIGLEPSGIPSDSLRPRDGSRFRKSHSITGPLVLYLGRISAQKGLLEAVESLRHIAQGHPDVKLVMIGPDYEGLGVLLSRRSAELGVRSNLLLLPPMLEEEEQLQAIAGCDVFIMPSTFEGFSQAVMKAMAQGRPTVVTNVGGLPFEVGFGTCGALCGRDPADLARVINLLLDDPSRSKTIGGNARERAKEFTFDKIASTVSASYLQLLS